MMSQENDVLLHILVIIAIPLVHGRTGGDSIMDHNFVLCVIYDTDVCLRDPKIPRLYITLTNLLEPWMSTPSASE